MIRYYKEKAFSVSSGLEAIRTALDAKHVPFVTMDETAYRLSAANGNLLTIFDRAVYGSNGNGPSEYAVAEPPFRDGGIRKQCMVCLFRGGAFDLLTLADGLGTGWTKECIRHIDVYALSRTSEILLYSSSGGRNTVRISASEYPEELGEEPYTEQFMESCVDSQFDRALGLISPYLD